MGALIAAVAVHAVGIDHKVEVGADAMEGVDKLQGVLVVDVIVSGAVSDLEHDGAVGDGAFLRGGTLRAGRVGGDAVDGAGAGVAVGVVLGVDMKRSV